MTKRSCQKPPKRVTIRDVACLADISIATVSYVLNNENRYLRPELRDRVLAAARELGYVKNAPACSLKGKRRGILAILVPEFGNSFFTRMCVPVEAVTSREGYIVTICSSNDKPEQERLILERLLAQRIDGCIISPALSLTDNVVLLQRHQIPFVILERTLAAPFPAQDFISHDNFQSGYLRPGDSLTPATGRRPSPAGTRPSPISASGWRAIRRRCGNMACRPDRPPFFSTI